MLGKIQKKIKLIYEYTIKFFRTYLAHIVFLVFTLQLLSYMSSLPYFNLISKYYYYVFGLLWIFSNFLFKKYITNDKILIIGIAMFFLAIPPSIIEFEPVADTLGFVAFIFLFTYVIRKVFAERESLQEI